MFTQGAHSHLPRKAAAGFSRITCCSDEIADQFSQLPSTGAKIALHHFPRRLRPFIALAFLLRPGIAHTIEDWRCPLGKADMAQPRSPVHFQNFPLLRHSRETAKPT